MTRLSLAMSLSVAGLVTTNALNVNSRRAFVAKAGSATTMGWLLNMPFHENECQCGQCSTVNGHSDGCQCSLCAVGGFANHDSACQCGSCAATPSLSLQPPAAMAYERDVGGADRSPEQAAFNLQARETNARLEKSGFKLDTKEEETARLSGALSSFSYDASTPKQATGKGYGNKNKSASPEKK